MLGRNASRGAIESWMASIDEFTAAKAVGMGVLLSAVNPKNLGLTLAAAPLGVRTAFAQTDSPDEDETRMDAPRFEAEVRALRAPLLVLRGSRSRVLTEAGIARLRALKPDLELATIEWAGHTPTLDEPAALGAIHDFLGKTAIRGS